MGEEISKDEFFSKDDDIDRSFPQFEISEIDSDVSGAPIKKEVQVGEEPQAPYIVAPAPIAVEEDLLTNIRKIKILRKKGKDTSYIRFFGDGKLADIKGQKKKNIPKIVMTLPNVGYAYKYKTIRGWGPHIKRIKVTPGKENTIVQIYLYKKYIKRFPKFKIAKGEKSFDIVISN